MAHLTPLPARRRAAGPVYQRLRDLIVRGRLGPGARVTEAQAAAELGVSRTPVREAMQRLVRDGLLVPANGEHGGRTRLVVAPMEVRIERVIKRDSTTSEKIMQRINNQLSDDDRIARSQYVITNITLEDTKNQVDKILNLLKNK